MFNDDLSRSKIININDFIFKQNLEFYPNLQGLSCQNNILSYISRNGIKVEVPLTFDLRTLPGEVWNDTPENFINAIKINKECKKLNGFLNLLNKYTNNEVNA